MSQKSLHSKDYQNLLYNLVENELLIKPSNIAELWIKMGEALEFEHIPKIQISTIIRKDIEEKRFQIQKDKPREECKYHSGYYFDTMRNHGWINPEMARNTKDDFDPLKDQKIVPCNNPDMKAVCYDIINLCRILIDKSKDGISFEDTFGEKQMNEFYKQMRTVLNNCKNAIDNKTKVPKNTEVFFLECLSIVTGSVNKCAQVFMEQNLKRLKKQGKFFTTKQASKFQKGGKQSKQIILNPTDRDQAIFLDYIGVQCECGSYRIRQKDNSYKLECYDCDRTMPQENGHVSKCDGCKIPLFKERLVHIVKTKKCDNCDQVVHLPPSLIEITKS